MVTWHKNHKGLFLFKVPVLLVGLIVPSLLLASCTPAGADEKGALPEEEVAPAVVDTKILQEGNDLPKTQRSQIRKAPVIINTSVKHCCTS